MRIKARTKIQSIIFSKKSFNKTKAKNWLKGYNFKYVKMHETEKYIRFRMFTPTNKKKRIGSVTSGVRFIYEIQ